MRGLRRLGISRVGLRRPVTTVNLGAAWTAQDANGSVSTVSDGYRLTKPGGVSAYDTGFRSTAGVAVASSMVLKIVPRSSAASVIIGLNDLPDASLSSYTDIDFGLNFDADQVAVLENEVGKTGFVACPIGTETFIEVTAAGAVKYWKTAVGTGTLLHTSAATASGTLYGDASLATPGAAFDVRLA